MRHRRGGGMAQRIRPSADQDHGVWSRSWPMRDAAGEEAQEGVRLAEVFADDAGDAVAGEEGAAEVFRERARTAGHAAAEIGEQEAEEHDPPCPAW